MENTCKIGDLYICYNAELIEHKENVCDQNLAVQIPYVVRLIGKAYGCLAVQAWCKQSLIAFILSPTLQNTFAAEFLGAVQKCVDDVSMRKQVFVNVEKGFCPPRCIPPRMVIWNKWFVCVGLA